MFKANKTVTQDVTTQKPPVTRPATTKPTTKVPLLEKMDVEENTKTEGLIIFF